MDTEVCGGGDGSGGRADNERRERTGVSSSKGRLFSLPLVVATTQAGDRTPSQRDSRGCFRDIACGYRVEVVHKIYTAAATGQSQTVGS